MFELIEIFITILTFNEVSTITQLNALELNTLVIMLIVYIMIWFFAFKLIRWILGVDFL